MKKDIEILAKSIVITKRRIHGDSFLTHQQTMKVLGNIWGWSEVWKKDVCQVLDLKCLYYIGDDLCVVKNDGERVLSWK